MSAGGAGPPAPAPGSAPAARGSVAPAEPGLSAPARGWVFAVTVAFLWVAAVLRSVLGFDGAQRVLVLVLLAAWLALVALVPAAARRWRPAFGLFLTVQAALIAFLLTQSNSSDFFAVLLGVPTMQATARWRPRAVAGLIAAFAALTFAGLTDEYGIAGALPLVALYAAADVFFAAYAYAARRALEARARSEALAAELREANRRLEESAEQAERLGAARERQNLARDLHDSVTQTLFGMTLTAQSALLLLERDPRGVEAQLDQLDELTGAARDELAALGAGSAPPAAGGVVAALRAHCAERRRRDGLEVAVEIDGDEILTAEEERALLRITQEALNNVAKHAGAGRAVVRLRLRRPLRLEVEDEGRGFDPREVQGAGLGLTSMRERAAERGWRLEVTSRPGDGTSVVAEEELAGDSGGERGRV